MAIWRGAHRARRFAREMLLSGLMQPVVVFSHQEADSGSPAGSRERRTGAAAQAQRGVGKAGTTSSALGYALIVRFGTLGRVPPPALLRNDDGLVFTNRSFTPLLHC